MRRLLVILALLVCGPALALDPGEAMKDPALEARARAISKDLRCLVCQNQSIDESDAPLAKDLRRIVRQRLGKGDSDAEVVAYITARYGDFVLLRPPVKPTTWLLWFGPPALFLVAIAVLAWHLRRRRRAPAAAPLPLSDEEKRRLAQIQAGRGDGA